MAKKKIIVKVVFETSVIYTGSASDLLRKEVSELILAHSDLNDLEINWYLPDIVLKERVFQMNKKGKELLPGIQKLEKLLGANLNITEKTIESCVKSAVQQQMETHKINEIKIDTSRINWVKLIEDSVFRNPPFQDGEKEKGFKDSLIVECLQHIIDDSPSSKSVCRIIFLSNDILMREAVNKRIENSSNTSMLSNIEELLSLINILSSEIKEELINSISEPAKLLFFEKDNPKSLYIKEGITERIKVKFEKELKILPPLAFRRTNGTWWVNQPGFVKKTNQKIYWKSIISQDFTSYIKKPIDYSVSSPYQMRITQSLQPESFKGLGQRLFTGQQSGILGSYDPSVHKILTDISSNQVVKQESSLYSQLMEEEEVQFTGKTKFEIIWSTTLTTTRKLINAKIEEINYVETSWK